MKLLSEFDISDTVVYTYTNRGNMYVADRTKTKFPTTFEEKYVKLYRESEAIQKANHLNRVGEYEWRVIRVSRDFLLNKDEPV